MCSNETHDSFGSVFFVPHWVCVQNAGFRIFFSKFRNNVLNRRCRWNKQICARGQEHTYACVCHSYFPLLYFLFIHFFSGSWCVRDIQTVTGKAIAENRFVCSNEHTWFVKPTWIVLIVRPINDKVHKFQHQMIHGVEIVSSVTLSSHWSEWINEWFDIVVVLVNMRINSKYICISIYILSMFIQYKLWQNCIWLCTCVVLDSFQYFHKTYKVNWIVQSDNGLKWIELNVILLYLLCTARNIQYWTWLVSLHCPRMFGMPIGKLYHFESTILWIAPFHIAAKSEAAWEPSSWMLNDKWITSGIRKKSNEGEMLTFWYYDR